MVLIPLYDRDPLERDVVPFVTYGLIAANVAVFLIELGLPPGSDEAFKVVVGLIPAVLTGEARLDDGIPHWMSLVTYMFSHGGWLHIGGNMIFLWVFGDNVEDAVGHARFLLFYLLCGVAGGAAYVFSDPQATTTLVGASGAIAGVVAAYVMLRPCARIEVLLFVIPIALDAYWAIGGWIVVQAWNIIEHTQDGTAWWAHLGGLIAGALLILVMRQPGVRLFDCMRPSRPA